MLINTPQHDILFTAVSAIDVLNVIKNTPKVDKVFILTDSNTSKLCLPRFLKAQKHSANFHVLEFESGEESKTIETCKYIWQALLKMEATRNSLLINLGGGVVTDLGGFVAGTYKRGIRYVNIPTTLLAQADASVGGKTAVDLDGLKNQVGLFYNPELVIVDITFLSTLSKREWLNGFAEMIKHALLQGKQEWQELIGASITNPVVVKELLYKSVKYKSSIVCDDLHEQGLRKVLNLGHTVGHAIETLFIENDKFSIKHGEAVVAGIIVEMFIAEKKVGLNPEITNEVVAYLQGFYELVKLEKTDFIRLIEIMKTDKKNRGAEYNFTLLQDFGKPLFDQHVMPADIELALRRYCTIA